MHPLFIYRCTNVWVEVLNNRLYRRLRDDSGACYSVSFSASRAEFSDPGFGILTATPLPGQTADALRDGVAVVLDLLSGRSPILASELEEARAPLVEEIRTSIKTNTYWHTLCSHLHAHRSWKGLGSLHGIIEFYSHVTLEDLQASLKAQWSLFPQPVPVHFCVGVSGSLEALKLIDAAAATSAGSSGSAGATSGAGATSKKAGAKAGLTAKRAAAAERESHHNPEQWRLLRDSALLVWKAFASRPAASAQ